MSAMLESISPIQTPKAAELVARHVRRYIVDAKVESGTRLPSEAELCARYAVSRTTIREAVRILESEGLVGANRAVQHGHFICTPGPEIIAKPAAFLLAIDKVPLSDVITACRAVEDNAVRLAVSEEGGTGFLALRRVVEHDLPAAFRSRSLARGALGFHRALVRASGSVTLAMVAETLHSILESHTEAVSDSKMYQDPDVFEVGYQRLRRSYGRMLDVMATGDPDDAVEHWNMHWTALEMILFAENKGVTVTEVVH
ncbi:DNA-binding transcriptional regulator, FadR family [Rhodococcus rhodochrous J3]|uniref:GntR family transcriptional regulator n=3 Tax=Rhodococcus rhodochrous TaxID=1829 RepID=A0AA46X0E9_RHORH|nr:GntR family transcriptional regulator [Rhodococcus rhodochrous]MBF4476771.1 FadR family transcriptional regulator [Rhodococcus rhodochrous]MCD2123710.1 GntR family transcriptional regulator [Rhodococcus rhodochrous]MCQ4136261.1 GntR family transcriptional regulator [Rhodococcus rhodochrous]UZF47816.1 GntR family transcriptional regulator [Rhodococcus rhodochrous]SMG59253.1 DNA-binding transcriptional regulator, FadR family [Rhodococcus rhodochrous J3]